MPRHTRRPACAAEAASATRRPARWLAALVLTALAGTALASATRAASASPWRRIDTPHFTVIGGVGERELGDVAAQFERFREVLAQLLPPQATAPVVPTVVIVFGSDKDFDPFKPVYRGKPIDVAGLFVPSADLNYIAVVAGSRGFRTVFHEYAHLVTANLRLSMPMWLNEGVAEYYSTFELLRGGRKANIGQPITSHVLLLRDEWLKLDALLAVQPDSPLYNEGDRRSVFYAQSWALVHYLLHGTPPRRDWLVKYMSAIEAGTSQGEAWNHIFGKQPVEVGLKDYVHRSQFQMVEVTLAERVETGAAAVGALSDDDAEAFLGDFVARQKGQDEVPARLELAAERPDGARARAALARLRASQNRPAEARALLARAQAATGDWLADYAVGVAAAETFALEPPEGGAAGIAFAREALQRTLRGRPDLAHAWHVLAGLALQADDLDAARDASESASFLAPARFEYTLRLADVFVRRREYAKARNALGPLLTNPRAAPLHEPVRSMLGSIAAVERAAAAPPDVAPAADDSDRGVVLDLRRLQSGEERAAGMLTRIDCARKSVTFHVRIDGQTAQFSAARFQDVEFVSYRDDLRGNVACGEREPEDLVFVTWRDDAAGAAGTPPPKTVVAVEFLPKDYRPKL